MKLGEPNVDPYGLEAAYRDATQATHHAQKSTLKKPIYKRVWFWVLVVALLLVVGVRVALNPVASHFTQEGLDSIPGYSGSFESVKVSIIPLTYTIADLKIEQDSDKTAKEPLVFVKEVRAQLFWRKLLLLQTVGTAGVDNAKFVVKLGVTKGPPADPKEPAVDDFQISSTLEKIIPFRVDRVEVRESEVTVLDATDTKQPEFWVSELELVLENLVSRKKLDENVPLSLTMRAVIAKTGLLKVIATADLLEEKPAFTGEAQLTGLKLESLYVWTSAKAGLSASGVVDAFVNFNSAKGKLSGDVKVMIKNPVVKPSDEKISDALKAKLANVAIKVLSDRVDGRNTIATTLPIKGTITNPDPQVWPTILGVVRNAFVQGLDWGFGDMPTPTADKKEGVLDQAAKALNKDEEAPKAQPNGGN